MDFFTRRNMAIVGLFQVGVIVAGVLAAGVTHKWFTTFNARLPSSTILLAEYGFLALVLPVVWIAVALLALRREDDPDSESVRWLAFLSGIVVLLLLLLGIVYAVVSPWLRLFGGSSLSA
jgi:hypothetical protein